jgi:flagellar hook-associated protein FlgK
MDNNLEKIEDEVNNFKKSIEDLQNDIDNNPNNKNIITKIEQTLEGLNKVDGLLENEIKKLRELLEDKWDNDDSK